MIVLQSIRRSALLAASGVALLVSPALAETYSIDAVHSTVGFSIRHLVSRTSGNFVDFAGAIEYDPTRLDQTTIEATIQVASIDTRNSKRDQHLAGADFLDATRFPTITFKSASAEVIDGALRITGALTMHGVERQIVLPVEVLGIGTHPRNGAPVAGFAGEVTIKRSDFGVNSWTDAAGVLGDEVTVQLSIEGLGEPPAK
jgi:polyisoprenoid-binding protein YceI